MSNKVTIIDELNTPSVVERIHNSDYVLSCKQIDGNYRTAGYTQSELSNIASEYPDMHSAINVCHEKGIGITFINGESIIVSQSLELIYDAIHSLRAIH